MSRLPIWAIVRALLVLLVLSAGAAYAMSVRMWQERVAGPSLELSIASGARDVAPGTPIGITTAGWNTEITSVTLTRADLDEQGNWGRSQTVPIRLVQQPLGERPGDTIGGVLSADGDSPVVADARYTLTLQGIFQEVALPLPWTRDVPIQRRIEFTTQFSPRPELPGKTIALDYGDRVELKWSAPMRSLEAVATPYAPVQVQLDAARPNLGILTLSHFKEGQEYLITINSGMGVNGIALQRPYTLRLIAPLLPHLEVPTKPALLTPWRQRVTIRSNIPLQTVQGSVQPAVKGRWSLDPKDPRVVYFDLEEYVQGQRYLATIGSAMARNGAPLQQPVSFEIVTPQPLQVVAVSPEVDAQLPADTVPSFTFSEPVADYEAAQAAITIDPPTAGHFEWPDPTTVRFVPDGGFAHDTRVSMTLNAGPGTVMAASGGYLEGQYGLTFTTPPNKRIEVDISEQKLRLWQGDEMVREFIVATGVTGADTPLGEFVVQYKMETARFRGTNPSGRTYDLPNVKWVLVFQGDYTIHGSYWRTVYGQPMSNGCVSMSDPNAEFVFYWAPEGTPISIHE